MASEVSINGKEERIQWFEKHRLRNAYILLLILQ
jgi:hypothetical protein